MRASPLELSSVDATGSERAEIIAAPADEPDEVMKEALQSLCRAYQCAGLCKRLDCLGVKLDREANGSDATLISAQDSAVPVLIFSADEEQVIAVDAVRVLLSQEQGGGAQYVLRRSPNCCCGLACDQKEET